jgi:hypothetical protein
MTILKDLLAIAEHPHEKLTTDTLEELTVANASLKKTQASRGARLLKVLEFLLQISGMIITTKMLGTKRFTVIIQKCIGLLLSGRVLEGTRARTEDYARHFGNLHDQFFRLRGIEPSVSLNKILSRKAVELRNSCVQMADEISFDDEQVWLWRGWPINNSTISIFPPFYYVYKKYGKRFTDKLYQACFSYFSGRMSSTIPCLDSLLFFLESDLCDFSEDELADDRFFLPFIEALGNFHTQYNLGKQPPCSSPVFLNNWSAHFRTFLADYLIPLGIIGAPHKGKVTANDIPIIPGDISKQAKRLIANTRETESGERYKCKTITPIPMHVTDDSVIEGIFAQMRDDYSMANAWSMAYIREIEKRLEELSTIAATGTAKIPSAPNSNLTEGMLLSERVKTATIYKNHGYTPDRRFYTKCYTPSYNLANSDLAKWLCLPKEEMFTAFTVLLAGKHEKVTNSFFDYCVVPDHRQDADGRVHLNQNYLEGSKPRAKKSRQLIELTSETAEVVKILIRLTNPVRKYLVDNHLKPQLQNRLFLSTGKGFGKPSGAKTGGMTGAARGRAISAQSMTDLIGLAPEDAIYLARNLSVNSMRDTSIVLKVLDHADLSIASADLDHAYFDLRLLEHYVPKLVLLYLMRREITNWDTRVLIQALNGHPSTARIAGFKTQAELEKYLLTSITLPYPLQKQPRTKNISDEVVLIGIDKDIIKILASLEMAVETDPDRATAVAIYWAGFCGAVRNWIYSDENNDPYLQEIFVEGYEERDVAFVEGVSYV